MAGAPLTLVDPNGGLVTFAAILSKRRIPKPVEPALSPYHIKGITLPDEQESRHTRPAHVLWNEKESLRTKRQELKKTEEEYHAQIKERRRFYWATSVAAITLISGSFWMAMAWTSPLLAPVLAPITITFLLATVLAWVSRPTEGLDSPEVLLLKIEALRDSVRFYSAVTHPTLRERRSLYREDITEMIEQYRADSRRYRRTHNTLQNLIMVGSASTTTIAALDSGSELTWQSLSIMLIGLTITLATAFTGYYKYRERSYFLLQTADSIEEESNAYALGVGPYENFTAEHEEAALKRLTQRVEEHRNEQRRRQQQLDQPAGQTSPESPSTT